MNALNATKPDLRRKRKRTYPKPTPYVAWCVAKLRHYADQIAELVLNNPSVPITKETYELEQELDRLANRLEKGRLKFGDYNSIIKYLHEIDQKE